MSTQQHAQSTIYSTPTQVGPMLHPEKTFFVRQSPFTTQQNCSTAQHSDPCSTLPHQFVGQSLCTTLQNFLYNLAKIPLPLPAYVHLPQQKKKQAMFLYNTLESQDRGKAPKPPASYQGPTMGADHSAGDNSNCPRALGVRLPLVGRLKQTLAGAVSQII